MTTTLAFDVYGTLIDTHGVVASLGALVGAEARAFSSVWRDKQLEYSFRRGLMRSYEDFAVCTGQALDYTCARFGLELTERQRADLLAVYRTLPAFPDAEPALARLRDGGFAIHAFSNGKAEAVEALLVAAGIRELFHGVVSVDDVGSFKPDPAVYHHFLRQSGADGAHAWLVSGNPFDVIGARSAGLRAAWIRRDPDAAFDPWGIAPDLTAADLGQFATLMLDGTGHGSS